MALSDLHRFGSAATLRDITGSTVVADCSATVHRSGATLASTRPRRNDSARAEELRPEGRRVAKSAKHVTGRWRIVEMDQWDQDAIDLVEPGFIEFARNGTGEFGFIAVNGGMDCRWSERDGRPFVEFTWEGNDETDQASGRGWAVLAEDGTLTGHLFFHLGEDSGFRATPFPGTGARGGR